MRLFASSPTAGVRPTTGSITLSSPASSSASKIAEQFTRLVRAGLIASALVSLAPTQNTIDWGAGWNTATSSGSYSVAGVAITLSTSPGVASVAQHPSAGELVLATGKPSGANQTWVVTFSKPVDVSIGLGHLNVSYEHVGNLSTPPSSVVVHPNHTWDGATLTGSHAAGGNFSTLTWSGITSLSFDHILVGSGGQLNIHDAVFYQSDEPPTADAGIDFSVNEGETGVTLDGSGSSDPDSDPLTYAWAQLGGTSVTLSDATSAQPTFTAPTVAIGGETLTFELTVTANGESDTDTMDVTVVNVNHPPVADAGVDQLFSTSNAVAEGSPVTLDGSGSFDPDSDTITYSWVRLVGGSPVANGTDGVTLSDPTAANPEFTAPYIAGSGAPGVVATYVFELTVDDSLPLDVPAPGHTNFDHVRDMVTVEITNVNNDPVADAAAGLAQNELTANENTLVTLDGTDSSDPDSDTLTYFWSQVGGSQSVTLSDVNSAIPNFTAPFVSPGGEDYTFELTVNDVYGGSAADTVIVHLQNANDPPDASAAQPTQGTLWPPNHKMVSIGITGVTDPNDNATIVITGVWQDEPTNGTGDGDTAIDAFINQDGTVLIRAERSGNGDGRVYHIHFTASDLEGSSSGVVTVSVPKSKKSTAIDGGQLHDSTTN